VILKLRDGDVVIKLRPDLAPKHVAQIKKLVKDKFYDGIVFHRVIPGFMAQTGDPTGTGTGGSKLPNIPPNSPPKRISSAVRSYGALEREEFCEFAVLYLLCRTACA